MPMEDLRTTLNALPGPALTKVDAEQRMRDLREGGGYGGGPDEGVKTEALAVYAAEKEYGTEFIAILGHLQEWQVDAEARLYQQRETERHARIAEAKRAAEARLRSGAHSPWTPAAGTADLHCIKNGRL
jgi:hypothetical protein